MGLLLLLLLLLKEESSMVKVPSSTVVGTIGSTSSKSTATRLVVVVVDVAVANKASGVTGTVPGNTTFLVTVPAFVSRVMVTGTSAWINC